ncbi:CsgG/HfaB family protein [Turneriella parva]|uniref:von Willebrand factor type A n=1 Tax=Turneriella parva (strain ATCC BAA-1111 / DSM 21527 / NCTC 11395 / H) TaxID=869212 RepID=I4B1T9_TURPD|nr:CsgG/HfaB family protein [Turneriella parva]AFM11246.1 von Willebrand factor type A [Turneriella parva DSM 21527]
MKHKLRLMCSVLAITTLTGQANAATLNDAANDVSAFFAKNPGKTVAVLAFKHGDAKAIAEVTGVQDRLTEQLVAAGKVTVIERDRIEQVLREHQIDQSGATAKTRIGELLQADYILTGSITPGKRKNLEVTARLVEIATSKIVLTARANVLRADVSEVITVQPRGNYLGEPLVQIAILIDTSSSMDGLIDQARTQIWKIVNTLAKGNREGRRPRIEVALYEYGNSNLPTEQNYIRQVLSFTSSLDKVSEKLFELKTNGGEEYCGAVIARALAELNWKKYDDVYRVVFIAGNEPFTQGPVDFRASVDAARQQGIFVNTIFCGSRQEGIATQWLTGAQLSQGDFHVINHDHMVQVVATPYDEEIQRLGAEYNSTVIPVGRAGAEEKDRMSVQDAKIAAAPAASGASIERAVAKNSEQYSESNEWDLTTIFSKKKSVTAVKREELPAELKGKSEKEIEAYAKQKSEKRSKIQARIDELSRRRNEYLSRESAKSAKGDDLGKATQASVKTQGKKLGFAF